MQRGRRGRGGVGRFSLLLIAFGAVAFDLLPLREYPDIDPPVVSVETALQTTWMLIVAVASTVAAAVSTGKRGGQDLTLAAGGGGGSGSSISVGPTDTVTTTVAVSTSTHR